MQARLTACPLHTLILKSRFPLPQPLADIDAYAVYVGFDPMGAQQEKETGSQAEAEIACETASKQIKGAQIALVQLFADVFDALGDQLAGELAFGFRAEDFLGGGNGGFGSGAADVGGCLRLGLGDFGLGHLGASGDEILDLRLGLGGQPLGFGFGARR